MDGEDYPIKLISMQNPVTTLNHKIWMKNGTFQEISNKVLSLRTSIDVVIFDECVYMLTLAGEKLFNMERAYKAICTTKIAIINDYNILTDFNSFASIAGSGHNPRKFVSFNDAHLQKLKNLGMRRKMSKLFSISLYYISFAPLWLSIIFIDVKSCIENLNNLWTEKISIVSIIICTLICLIIFRIEFKFNGKESTIPEILKQAKEEKTMTAEYLLSYILPLFAFDFTVWN